QVPGYISRQVAGAQLSTSNVTAPTSTAAPAITAASIADAATTTLATKFDPLPNYVWPDPSERIDMERNSIRGAFGPNSSFEEAAISLATLDDSNFWSENAPSSPAPFVNHPLMFSQNTTDGVFNGPGVTSPGPWLNMPSGYSLGETGEIPAAALLPAGEIAQQTLVSPSIISSVATGPASQMMMPYLPTLDTAGMAFCGSMLSDSSLVPFVPMGQDALNIFSGMQPATTSNMPFAGMPDMDVLSPAAWTVGCATSDDVFPVSAPRGEPFSDINMSNGDAPFAEPSLLLDSPALQMPVSSFLAKATVPLVFPPATTQPDAQLQAGFHTMRKPHMVQTDPVAKYGHIVQQQQQQQQQKKRQGQRQAQAGPVTAGRSAVVGTEATVLPALDDCEVNKAHAFGSFGRLSDWPSSPLTGAANVLFGWPAVL
ncbi:MAG: hypothetical protein STHCBS139747_004178, partial [Sporothrix thermara]